MHLYSLKLVKTGRGLQEILGDVKFQNYHKQEDRNLCLYIYSQKNLGGVCLAKFWKNFPLVLMIKLPNLLSNKRLRERLMLSKNKLTM